MKTITQRPLLQFRFKGPGVPEGRILYADLSQFISNFQAAIERTINVLETGTSIRVGRPTKAIQLFSALEVIATARGSFKIALGLRRDSQLLPGFDLGEHAISTVLDGLTRVTTNEPLPEALDQGVLIALREAGRIFDHGVDTVNIRTSTQIGQRRMTFGKDHREHIISRIHAFERTWAEAEGRLLMADVKEGALHCRLHPSAGDPILCTFTEDLTPLILRYMRQFVQVRGEASVDPVTMRLQSMTIRDLEIVEQPSNLLISTAPLSGFWKAKTFNELATEQAVYPVEDLTKLSSDSIDDAEFEKFFAVISEAHKDN